MTKIAENLIQTRYYWERQGQEQRKKKDKKKKRGDLRSCDHGDMQDACRREKAKCEGECRSEASYNPEPSSLNIGYVKHYNSEDGQHRAKKGYYAPEDIESYFLSI
jgi:hypothetical protein